MSAKQVNVLYLDLSNDSAMSSAISQALKSAIANGTIFQFPGNQFPSLWPVLSGEREFHVLVLHLLHPRGELGEHESSCDFGTGLVRAEQLRNNGLEIPIIILSATAGDEHRRSVRDCDNRLRQADCQLVCYGADDNLRSIVDAVLSAIGCKA